MFTIIESNQSTSEIHVHAAGCKDVTKSKNYFKKNYSGTPDTWDYQSQEQAAIDMFGEVAADMYEWDTEEWLAQVMYEWNTIAHIYPCAKK